jgi:hypothetical protein
LKAKCEFLKLEGGDDYFEPSMDIISSKIPCNPSHPDNQEEIKIEQALSDYSYSKDVPEELRMIHMFLRESNQLKYKFTPNYARFKWMARNIFRYVGEERSMARMAESLSQKVYIDTQWAATNRLAIWCFDLLREEERVKHVRMKMKQHIINDYIKELS